MMDNRWIEDWMESERHEIQPELVNWMETDQSQFSYGRNRQIDKNIYKSKKAS